MTGPAPDGRPSAPDPDPVGPDPVDPDPPESLSPLDASVPDGPPGGSVFTLEGRRAPGLYLIGWILSVGGLAIMFLGFVASDAAAGGVLLFFGAVLATLGFAAAAGSQVLERAVRDPERYRGPTPLLVWGAYFLAMALIGLVLIVLIGVDPDQPFSFLGIGVVQTAGYLLIVWLFAVRTGALTWRQMGWLSWDGPSLRSALRGIGVGIGVMLPVTFGILILGGIVGLLLGVDAPQVLPLSETVLDGFFVALAAAFIIPIGEELFYRGFALTAWMRDLGERTALIRSTAFFALVHIANIGGVPFLEGLRQAILTLLVIAPVGYVLGRLFIRHGMSGAIAGHVTYNSLLLTLAFLASKIPEPV